MNQPPKIIMTPETRAKAVEFLRFYFTYDPRSEVGRGEATEALSGVLEILHGSEVLDVELCRSFEDWTQTHQPKVL